MDEVIVYCPYCGSPNTKCLGGTLYVCMNCGNKFEKKEKNKKEE